MAGLYRFTPTFAAGVLWQRGDQILIVSRQKREANKRYSKYDWGLPAAKQRIDEEPYNTAARALAKETGVVRINLFPLMAVPADITGTLDFYLYGLQFGPDVRTHLDRKGKYLVRFAHPTDLLLSATYDNAVYRSNLYILRMLGFNV